MKGKELQDSIVELARMRGWRCAHFSPGRVGPKNNWITNYAYDSKGFPDLVLVRDRVVVIEVKGDGDTLKQEQQQWGEAFRNAGSEFYVATPKAWREGFIDKVLK